MLQPSPAAIDQLDLLLEPPRRSLIDRVVGRTPPPARACVPSSTATLAAALTALVETRDWRALPYVGWLLTTDVPPLSVVECIRALMPSQDEALERLDLGMRENPWALPTWWQSKKPFPGVPALLVEQASRLLRDFPRDVALAGYLSLCSSGHVREMAVRALIEDGSGRELSFLLLRANDWVEPVARLAMQALSARLRPGYEKHFSERLAAVARMRERRRSDHSDFVERVEGFLSETVEGRGALLEAFDGGDRGLRRACADLVRRRFPAAEGPYRSAVEGFLRDSDQVVRVRAVEAIARLSPDEDLAAWVAQLRADRSAAIRRRVWSLAEQRLPALADELASEYLFDRNMWLREFARQRLRGLGIQDFAARYREAIGRGAHVEGAVLGLGETGTAADAAVVSPLVETGPTRVRRAAMTVITTLDRERAPAVLLRVLASGDPGVGGTAAARLRALRVFIPTEEIEPLLRLPMPRVRARALEILRRRDRWGVLIWALRLRGDPEPAVARSVERVLLGWRYLPGNLYVQPTASQRAELVGMLGTLDDEPAVRETVGRLVGV